MVHVLATRISTMFIQDAVIRVDHDRALGRIEIEPDHVDHLLGQLRILREFERADLMGLELVLAPDPLDLRVIDLTRSA